MSFDTSPTTSDALFGRISRLDTCDDLELPANDDLQAYVADKLGLPTCGTLFTRILLPDGSQVECDLVWTRITKGDALLEVHPDHLNV